MKRHLFLILAVFVVLAADSPKPDPREDAAAKELAKLQGKWKLVAEDSDGTVTETNQGAVIGFDKEFLIGYDGDGGVATKDTVKLNPTESPKEIDQTCVINVLFPSEKGRITPGIYELKDDKLKMAFPYAPNRERPKEFTTKKRSNFVVFTYKRTKS